MRRLELNDNEICLVLGALGIAEQKFMDLREQYIDRVVNVRDNHEQSENVKEVSRMFDMANKFSDLLISIKNGEKDV